MARSILPLIEYLTNKISIKCDKNHTRYELQGYITDNAKKKNLICCMTAFLDEAVQSDDIEKIKQLLFETRFDIEHIHANADETIIVDNVLQNGIGNLSMLEENINRSISDGVFENKKVRYKESNFSSIKELLNFDKWTEIEIKERREQKVDRIMKYLFD